MSSFIKAEQPPTAFLYINMQSFSRKQADEFTFSAVRKLNLSRTVPAALLESTV